MPNVHHIVGQERKLTSKLFVASKRENLAVAKRTERRKRKEKYIICALIDKTEVKLASSHGFFFKELIRA
jgi:hypothetical protein